MAITEWFPLFSYQNRQKKRTHSRGLQSCVCVHFSIDSIWGQAVAVPASFARMATWRIFPEIVLGSSFTNSIMRGYL